MPSLTFQNRQFSLNGKSFHVFSGAIHYFRVVPQYWKDRLQKAKSCGLNTVETYVPWNLHEPRQGHFTTDGMLDVRAFISLASEVGLKVILRPGPYICSEWDFGGLPSWLMSDRNMNVRSNYQPYKDAAEKYINWIIGLVSDLQYSNGGPIIAVQVENEFGSYSNDITHLEFIKSTMVKAGVTELLMTSDNPWGNSPSLYLPDVLPTANFQTVDEGKQIIDVLEKSNKDFPLMVMEFWAGWFDHWGSKHSVRSVQLLEEVFKYILEKNGSVNFYMFHGGTNFGFMAGANMTSAYKPDVTSYDYDAPLSEDGRMTDKYLKIKEMIKDFKTKSGLKIDEPKPGNPDVNLMQIPKVIESRKEIHVQEVMPWSDMIGLVKKVTNFYYSLPMEMYNFPNGEIQSYGYIIYRKTIASANASLGKLVLPQYTKDRATVALDGKVVAVFDQKNDTFSVDLSSAGSSSVLDIIVENQGRVNYADKENPNVLNQQRKGIDGDITLDGKSLNDWTIIALDFPSSYMTDLSNSNAWQTVNTTDVDNDTASNIRSPAMYRSKFDMEGNPGDCFVKLHGFTKGIVLINGFNLGRHWNIGPQHTLYLPGPLLKGGQNEIMTFEESNAGSLISLETQPILA